MQMLHNNDFAAGAAIGLVLLSAFALSPLFRRMTLAAMSFAIIRAYLASGADGLLKTSKMVRIDLISNHPDFSHGLAVGAGLTILSIFIARRRST
jgi:hypothetical protein